jgi:hypothetical protein
MEEKSPADVILAHQARLDAINNGEGEPRNALEYVQDVYRGRRIADPWRMRAAIAALQFETPRLGVVATTNLNDKDFAALLDRAIERSNGVREVKQIKRALRKPE